MVKVRVVIGTLAYGTAEDRKVAQKGDVIELSEEQLSKLAVAPAIPATVERLGGLAEARSAVRLPPLSNEKATKTSSPK